MTDLNLHPQARERAWSSEEGLAVQRIVPLRAWIGLGALISLLVLLLAWGSFGSITIETRAEGVLRAGASAAEKGAAVARPDNPAIVEADGAGEPLRAVIFLPLERRIGIRAGLPARVLPRGLNAYRYGEMLGLVAAVEPSPASRSRLAAVLADPDLVERMMRAGTQYEVDIELQTDSAAPSGLAWSAGKGPDVRLAAGTLVTAAILLERRHPFALFSPEATP